MKDAEADEEVAVTQAEALVGDAPQMAAFVRARRTPRRRPRQRTPRLKANSWINAFLELVTVVVRRVKVLSNSITLGKSNSKV